MNFNATMAKLQDDINRLIALEIAIELIVAIVATWVLYLVVKAAVRDGIKESGLLRNTWERTVERHEARKQEAPDMRAD